MSPSNQIVEYKQWYAATAFASQVYDYERDNSFSGFYSPVFESSYHVVVVWHHTTIIIFLNEKNWTFQVDFQI